MIIEEVVDKCYCCGKPLTDYLDTCEMEDGRQFCRDCWDIISARLDSAINNVINQVRMERSKPKELKFKLK